MKYPLAALYGIYLSIVVESLSYEIRNMSDTNVNSVVQYKKISSKIIPGVLHSHNKGTLDW